MHCPACEESGKVLCTDLIMGLLVSRVLKLQLLPGLYPLRSDAKDLLTTFLGFLCKKYQEIGINGKNRIVQNVSNNTMKKA